MDDWEIAAGSCGFNTGDRHIYGRYVNGVALFCWGFSVDPNKWHICVIKGHCTVGGLTRQTTMEDAVRFAIENGASGADRRISKSEFKSIMSDTERLPIAP